MRRPMVPTCLLVALLAGGACAESPAAPAITQTQSASLPALPARAGSLVVESFFVVEYQYPGHAGWFYAPQVVVSSPAGGSGVDLGLMELTVTGIGQSPPFVLCRRVADGTEITLGKEIYGDYEMSIDQPGVRASSPDATIAFSFTDGLGRVATVSAKGPVVAGELPKTYSGGTGSVCR